MTKRITRHRRISSIDDLFTPDDSVLTTIANVIEKRQCCRLLTFRLTAEPDNGPIWLELSGPPGTSEFLAGMLEL